MQDSRALVQTTKSRGSKKQMMEETLSSVPHQGKQRVGGPLGAASSRPPLLPKDTDSNRPASS